MLAFLPPVTSPHARPRSPGPSDERGPDGSRSTGRSMTPWPRPTRWPPTRPRSNPLPDKEPVHLFGTQSRFQLRFAQRYSVSGFSPSRPRFFFGVGGGAVEWFSRVALVSDHSIFLERSAHPGCKRLLTPLFSYFSPQNISPYRLQYPKRDWLLLFSQTQLEKLTNVR